MQPMLTSSFQFAKFCFTLILQTIPFLVVRVLRIHLFGILSFDLSNVFIRCVVSSKPQKGKNEHFPHLFQYDLELCIGQRKWWTLFHCHVTCNKINRQDIYEMNTIDR